MKRGKRLDLLTTGVAPAAIAVMLFHGSYYLWFERVQTEVLLHDIILLVIIAVSVDLIANFAYVEGYNDFAKELDDALNKEGAVKWKSKVK